MGTGGSPFNALQASYHPVIENKHTNTHPFQCDILNCFIVLFIEAGFWTLGEGKATSEAVARVNIGPVNSNSYKVRLTSLTKVLDSKDSFLFDS